MSLERCSISDPADLAAVTHSVRSPTSAAREGATRHELSLHAVAPQTFTFEIFYYRRIMGHHVSRAGRSTEERSRMRRHYVPLAVLALLSSVILGIDSGPVAAY